MLPLKSNYPHWYLAMFIVIIRHSIPSVMTSREADLTNSKTGNDSAELGRKKHFNNYIIIYQFYCSAHIKGDTRWSRNLTVVLTISLSSSLLSTTMRIPTDQAFTFIAATGQLSGLLKLRKIFIVLSVACTMQLIFVGCYFI